MVVAGVGTGASAEGGSSRGMIVVRAVAGVLVWVMTFSGT